MFKILINIALIVMFITPFKADSQQEYFFKNSSTLGIEFNYQWQSEDGIRKLKFLLTHTDIDKLPTSAPAYNTLLAQNYIHRNLLEYAKTIDPKIANISIKRSAGSLNMQVSGKYPEQIDKITATLGKKHEEAEAEYLTKNYYVPFKNEMGRLTIKQDHRRYAEESSNHLSGVVLAIKEQLNNPNNAREFIDFTLNWLQTIPYDTLENRISSNGSGFAAPQQLLLNNRGDCDSKSTLFLALLKSYNPTLSAKMVFLRNHALVGVNMNPNETDAQIVQNNLSYILAEPTGAAQYKLGEIAPSSQIAIRNQQFTTELF
ncbi:hypothetical protein [Glaciecola sp. 33A]|jgi:hypothetical protein|uniref:hypothetical protein n=1 Tax=Glaciecola sp. 33A TaxID=2057807 RepID=UPI0012FEAEF8|nr:hypothetical protein [Glaciecola sp. 33A]